MTEPQCTRESLEISPVTSNPRARAEGWGGETTLLFQQCSCHEPCCCLGKPFYRVLAVNPRYLWPVIEGTAPPSAPLHSERVGGENNANFRRFNENSTRKLYWPRKEMDSVFASTAFVKSRLLTRLVPDGNGFRRFGSFLTGGTDVSETS
ncbi:hypothetical protein NPIL_526191 [Nephila pilipes]|uniref:Uncharacterized protein n=1 Tax=Nephila pilipes TaxID=299642 RepID=A0A8X6PW12_NEPPI|nr:hypothetical protein NPIL_526191 [Nephila pilipes]